MTTDDSRPASDAGRIALPGTHNLRTVSAPALRVGALLRSDALHALDPSSWSALADRGVRTVIDLRGDDEKGVATGARAAAVGIRVESAPVFAAGAADYVATGASIDDLYADLLGRHAPGLVTAVDAVAAAPEGAVLVHCSAGKDRTGIVIALVLLAIGVDRSAVVDDYSTSEELLRASWLDERLRWLAGFHRPAVLEASLELIGGSPRRAIETVIDRIGSEWGSAEAFLRAHGLTDAALASLRARFSG
ncbi:tyrosine-protein phosphatase [Galbitalea sp. SE-J8]|uniref:tyrosine-protein phosphatase n=1 Tax=Galbitalea sp. SE-J8 TaxID=3054952 RepID=UPI00259CE15D|nr:tyrosine-protein phosphatase [Galbitalea sp. SE-J8]MDM4761615.1 tyrosine-protein phosphatase [Galbitalea sp. SE-J8]